MPHIDWAEFSWEAFATLFTGVIAVIAAAQVGTRQLEIMAKQTDLEALKLRSELFEKRMEVYMTAHRWLAYVMRHMAIADDELKYEYARAMDKAQFLFRPQVHKRMKELWDLGARLNLHKAKEEHQQVGDIAVQLVNEIEKLAELFGPDLRLGADAQPAKVVVAEPQASWLEQSLSDRLNALKKSMTSPGPGLERKSSGPAPTARPTSSQ